MAVPRQKLYGIEPARLLLRGLAGRLDSGDRAQIRADFDAAFARQTGLTGAIPLSRGRYGFARFLEETCSAQRDEVILCPFTIVDMINMILVGGGKPVFVDSGVGTPHPSPEAIAARIGPRTAAVMIIHYHEPHPQIAQIAALCRDRGVALIEDCAIGLGSRVEGRSVGTFGDAALFSFGLFKTVSAPYGGALSLRDPALRARIEAETEAFEQATLSDLQPYLGLAFIYRAITSHAVFSGAVFPLVRQAFRRGWTAVTKRLDNDPDLDLRTVIPDAWRKKPSNTQLRSWIRQLAELDTIVAGRHAVATVYARELAGQDCILGPAVTAGDGRGYSSYPVYLSGGNRDAALRAMIAEGFDLTQHYYRNCAEAPVFAPWAATLPNLSAYRMKTLVLPCHPGVTLAYAARLARGLRGIVLRRDRV